ncbi:4Fe-4S dicluster domain-containing protein [Candidatus Bathyarchaeota archaeon]|nr:4Fe-4S dicluster domain-containing protein [Candidatus Bathyarchaeota archaeon]
MEMHVIRVFLYSPTGTTRKVVEAIIDGLEIQEVHLVDLTKPSVREQIIGRIYEDLVIFAVPVYFNHAPREVVDILEGVEGEGKPVILLAVYGNVGYGKVLWDLQEASQEASLIPVAAATFVGEHSFSHPEFPIAPGRPDDEDLHIARDFGGRVRNIMDGIEEPSLASLDPLPWKMPFLSRMIPDSFARYATREPRIDLEKCTRCGTCVKKCPVQAIDRSTLVIDGNSCTRCFACVKYCPATARIIAFKRPRLLRWFFSKHASRRRSARLFLPKNPSE